MIYKGKNIKGQLQQYQTFHLVANCVQNFHLCHCMYQTFKKFTVQVQNDYFRQFDLRNCLLVLEIRNLIISSKKAKNLLDIINQK